MEDAIMPENNRVQYNLSGLKNLGLTENLLFKIADNQYIEAIHLDDDLTKVVVHLKDGVHYIDKASDIDSFVKQIFFNLVAKTDADIVCPNWYTEGIFENGKFEVTERMDFREEATVFRSYSAEGIYDTVVNSPTAIHKHAVLYERIFGVLQNENPVVQFMTLYQILLEETSRLAGGKSRGQSNIVNYLKVHESKYPFIQFQPSRDSRKKDRDEDTFTYIRNEIGHCEETNDFIAYKQAGQKITNALIKNILIVLNDVIMEL